MADNPVVTSLDPLLAAHEAGHITEGEFQSEARRLLDAAGYAQVDSGLRMAVDTQRVRLLELAEENLASAHARFRASRRTRLMILCCALVLVGLACWDFLRGDLRVAFAESGWAVAIAGWARSQRAVAEMDRVMAQINATLARLP